MHSAVTAALLYLAATAFAAPAPGKDSECDITVKPSESIQTAINNAKKGDRIIVEAGVYHEQLTITKDGIHLIGRGATLLPPKDNYTTNFCTGLSRNIQVDNSETDAGICIYSTSFELGPYNPALLHRNISVVGDYIKDVVVTGFNITGFNGENIALIGGEDVKISKNTLINGAQYGFLTVGSKNTKADGNVVTSSALSFIAMCMDDKSSATFSNNKISNYYIALCGETSGGVMKKNTISNCCIGPFIDPGIKGVRVIENTVTGRNAYCPPGDGAGIAILGASDTIVERNTFEYIKGENNTGAGIFVSDDPVTGAKASGNVFKKNVVRFNGLDILNNGTATDNVFKNNDCQSSFPEGLCNN